MSYLWPIQKLKFIDKTSKKETVNSPNTTETIHIRLKNDWVKTTHSFNMTLIIILSNVDQEKIYEIIQD